MGGLGLFGWSSRVWTGWLGAILCILPAALFPASASATPLDSPAVPGANDWSCRPSAEHPRPVILVHGTWAGAQATWTELPKALHQQGYCVFALDYGATSPGPRQNVLKLAGGSSIQSSAKALGAFVERVRRTTGATQVDLVGHSQGALVARQYMKFEGGADTASPRRNIVRTLVTLAGTNHGTSFGINQSIGALAQRFGIPVVKVAATIVGPSYVEQMYGSPFLHRLNAGGDTLPGVNYLAIGTKNDKMVTPPERTFLRPGPGAKVENIWLQDGCPSASVDHMGVANDPRSIWLVADALGSRYESSHVEPCP